MEYIPIILAVAIILLLFGVFIYIGVNDKKWKKQAQDEEIEKQKREESPERKELKATVISKRILDSYEGFIVSRYVLDFLVGFQIENGAVEFSVTQEFFDKITENDTGILITINGELYDFIKE